MPPTSTLLIVTLLAIAALFALAFFTRWLLQNPRGDFEAGVLWHGARLYSRMLHRLEVRGREHVPQTASPGPLILVINHTAGVDPVLVQAATPFEVRWVMASDMRHPFGEPLWQWLRVIFVDRAGTESRSAASGGGAREAIRHVRDGGVLGIFPEGAIERPPRTLLPFQPGVGFIIRRTEAPVIPVLIEGTPESPQAWGSLWRRSRSRVTFFPPVQYAGQKRSPEAIADDLRGRFATWTGWPLATPSQAEQPDTSPGESTRTGTAAASSPSQG